MTRYYSNFSNKDVNVLITTGDGKFYSNGVDLEKVQYYTEKELEEFGEKVQLLYKRILTYPMVTIAAINGIPFKIPYIVNVIHLRSCLCRWCHTCSST